MWWCGCQEQRAFVNVAKGRTAQDLAGRLCSRWLQGQAVECRNTAPIARHLIAVSRPSPYRSLRSRDTQLQGGAPVAPGMANALHVALRRPPTAATCANAPSRPAILCPPPAPLPLDGEPHTCGAHTHQGMPSIMAAHLEGQVEAADKAAHAPQRRRNVGQRGRVGLVGLLWGRKGGGGSHQRLYMQSACNAQ